MTDGLGLFERCGMRVSQGFILLLRRLKGRRDMAVEILRNAMRSRGQLMDSRGIRNLAKNPDGSFVQ